MTQHEDLILRLERAEDIARSMRAHSNRVNEAMSDFYHTPTISASEDAMATLAENVAFLLRALQSKEAG